MDPHVLARTPALARGDGALSRRIFFGRAALGAAAVAGLGPRSGLASQATSDAGVADLVAGNTAFALDLYAALRRFADGNLVFSPYSVSQSLAMTYVGAGGETATQMAETLSLPLEQPALNAAFAELTADLVRRGSAEAGLGTVVAGGPPIEQTARALRVANRLWGEQTYPFSPAFSEQLEASYGASLEGTDFQNAPEEARDEINGWVAEQTEDRILDIVPTGVITPSTLLVLVNAIYFYGGWEKWFRPEVTEDGDFFLLDGATVTVPFMVQRNRINYARGDGFQVVELPYMGSGFAFTAILPDEGGFEAIEAGLDAAALHAAIGQLEFTDLLVYLPRFRFESGAISLKPALQAMGMADAFDSERANFAGMVEGTPPQPLYIGDALHKAFISVDEEGTEAAAVTIVSILPGAGGPVETPPEVRIDRPFLFAIRDTQTGTLLFLGRVMDPSS